MVRSLIVVSEDALHEDVNFPHGVRNFPLPPRIPRSWNSFTTAQWPLIHIAVSAYLNSRTFKSYCERVVGQSQCSGLFSSFGLTHSPILGLYITMSFPVTQTKESRRPAAPLCFHSLLFLSPMFRSCPFTSYPIPDASFLVHRLLCFHLVFSLESTIMLRAFVFIHQTVLLHAQM